MKRIGALPTFFLLESRKGPIREKVSTISKVKPNRVMKSNAPVRPQSHCPSKPGRLAFVGAVCCATALTTPVQAAFHLWNIREVYRDRKSTRLNSSHVA